MDQAWALERQGSWTFYNLLIYFTLYITSMFGCDWCCMIAYIYIYVQQISINNSMLVISLPTIHQEYASATRNYAYLCVCVPSQFPLFPRIWTLNVFLARGLVLRNKAPLRNSESWSQQKKCATLKTHFLHISLLKS